MYFVDFTGSFIVKDRSLFFFLHSEYITEQHDKAVEIPVKINK